MQEKTNQLVTSATINRSQNQILKINIRADEPITLDGTSMQDVNDFVYLGSKITTDGDSKVDVQARISKVTGAYAALRSIWRSSKISNHTNVRIFKSNVLGVLLYGAESWKVTNAITTRLDVFQTRCLRRILRIFWPNTISNEELYKRTNTIPLSQEIKRGRWTCIGHVCRMHPTSIPRVALRWTPTGKRKRGRPKETWRRSVEKEMKEKDWTWGQVQHWSQDRQAWKSLVMALCAFQHEED
jgi:hypothetical protein